MADQDKKEIPECRSLNIVKNLRRKDTNMTKIKKTSQQIERF